MAASRRLPGPLCRRKTVSVRNLSGAWWRPVKAAPEPQANRRVWVSKRSMRHLIALTCLPFLLGYAPSQDDLPVRQTMVFACGFVVEPPKTPAEWARRADVVMHVRIDSQVGFETSPYGSRIDVMTAHEATVLALVKGHPRAVAEGASQSILQSGGRVRRADHYLLETVNGFDVMPVGSEWVVFLKWDARLNAFTLFYREYGAVRVQDGRIASKKARDHQAWDGRPAGEFLSAVGRPGMQERD